MNEYNCKDRKITNGDRIRKMTNQQIVDWISSNSESIVPFACPPEHKECDDNCRQCWLDWLNSEYEGK